MDPTSSRLLDEFAAAADKEHLLPLDWRRFYDFILDAHHRDVEIGADEVRTKLRAADFSERRARELAGFYVRARELLEHREDWVL
ncbi:MAG TPA: hypothetical protein VNM66_01825 [Thermodesulfobacteriota bacterium]|nr:hypothetical protein [Thermodesulfobacteriota bacterium]